MLLYVSPPVKLTHAQAACLSSQTLKASEPVIFNFMNLGIINSHQVNEYAERA